MSRRPSRHTHVIFVRGCTAPPRHHATGHLVGCALFTSRTFAAVAELRLHCCCPHGYRVLSVVHVVVVIYERVLVCYRVTFSVLGISSSISVATSAPEQLAVQYSSGWSYVFCILAIEVLRFISKCAYICASLGKQAGGVFAGFLSSDSLLSSFFRRAFQRVVTPLPDQWRRKLAAAIGSR